MPTPSPTKWPIVLENADVKIAAAQDQEQVDKLLSIADRLKLADRTSSTTRTRGLRDYAETNLHLARRPDGGRDAPRSTPKPRSNARSTPRSTPAAATTPRSCSTRRARRAAPRASCSPAGRSVAAARDTVAFDHLTERDEQLAYLPLAWVGDHYMNYAQAYVAGSCIACPESADTVQQDLREIGPSFYFAPPRVFESQLTRIMIRMEDASRAQAQDVPSLHRRRRANGARRSSTASACRCCARLHYALGEMLVYGPLKNVLGFSNIRVAYTAGEAIGADLFSFYRSLGLNLKQLYGQTEAFLYVTAHPDGAIRAETVGPPAPNVDDPHRRGRRGAVQIARPVRRPITRTRTRPPRR